MNACSIVDGRDRSVLQIMVSSLSELEAAHALAHAKARGT